MKLNKLFVFVLASLIFFGVACIPAEGQIGMFIAGGTGGINQVFHVGDKYTISIQNVPQAQYGAALSLCKVPPSSVTSSCTANYGTVDNNGNWYTTGTFTQNDIGTWVWYTTISTLTSKDVVFAVLALPGDSGGNPPPPPPTQVLIAADGFPSATLATLSSWMNFLNQGFVLADVFAPVIISRSVKMSPSPDVFYYTGAPDQIWFQTTITASTNTTEGGDYWALCREIAHTRNFPFIFGNIFAESWATAECRQVYRAIAQHFPQAWNATPSPSLYGTDGKLLDTYGDRKAVVYGPGFSLINLQNDTGSALLDIYSERLRSLGDMQYAINHGQFAPAGDQAANLDGLAQSLGVTNVEGVRPSVLFRRNAINFGTAPDGTYLGISGGMDVGAGSGYSIDLMRYQNRTPSRVGGIIDWTFSDSSGRIIVSGTLNLVAGSQGYMFFSDHKELVQDGKFLLSEGAYSFAAIARDSSGRPSADPNLAAGALFKRIERTMSVGDLAIAANGETGKFGNLGSCNDLTLVAPQGASISGSSGLCFVTNVPKRTAGGYEDVTLSGYGFITTFVPSSTSAAVRNFKHLDQPAYLQKVLRVDGSTATSVVPGEILMLTGIDFTANDPSVTGKPHLVGTPRRAMTAATVTTRVVLPLPTPMPPRHGGPAFPTEGCTGTELSDQGRSEVWFSENGIIAKALVSSCQDNQMEIVVPAHLTVGGTVEIQVVVNGTPGLNALTLPVTAK